MVAEIVGPSTQIILELLLPTCFWKLSLGHGQMSKATDPASWHSHPPAARSSPPEFECDAKGLSLVFGLSKAAVLANASPHHDTFLGYPGSCTEFGQSPLCCLAWPKKCTRHQQFSPMQTLKSSLFHQNIECCLPLVAFSGYGPTLGTKKHKGWFAPQNHKPITGVTSFEALN
jgi:hypothetical protein